MTEARLSKIDRAAQAITEARRNREHQRRSESFHTFGHTGASIPSCPPLTLEEELRIAFDAAEDADRA